MNRALKYKTKIIHCLLSLFLFLPDFVVAQTEESKPAIQVSAYMEVYYGFDLNQPDNHTRPPFIYSHNRHNEFNLNLGFLKASYQGSSVRANLALMAGTYANANLAAEPGVLKQVFEANAGVKLSKKKNLWLDAGIFASHIGFESAISKDCWNLTRSIMADNSPYYESGAKLSYTSDNEKWFASLLLLNGWQKIQRQSGNSTPAFGHQLTYKPNSKLTFNSSSFMGSDHPDSIRKMRYFHNLYGIYQINEKLAFTLGFDVGVEQKSKKSRAYNSWYTPVFMAQYRFNQKSALAARTEYYQDAHGVIIPTQTPNGFRTWGFSLNYDRQINRFAVWRIEGRKFQSKDAIFEKGNQPKHASVFFTTSLALAF